MRRLSSLVLLGGAAALLTACASSSSVDLDAARDWIEEVQQSESDGPGGAGTASLLVGAEADAGVDDDDTDAHVTRLDFTNPTVLVRADARCYGDGTNVVEVGVTAYSENGSEAYSYGQSIACDKEPHSIALGDGMMSSAAVIEATSGTTTYVHVTLIEEMVVER